MKEKMIDVLSKLGLLRAAFYVYEKSKLLQKSTQEPAFTGGFPLPQEYLRIKVAGCKDGQWFLESGKRGIDCIMECLKRNSIDVSQLKRILDFGCGCGRVLRHWHGAADLEINGCDYNQELVLWCKKNLPFGHYVLNELAPPTSYSANRFELIYAFSVFTHLSEDLQLAWLREMRRILVPGGYLIFSTQGDRYMTEFSSAEKDDFMGGKLLVRYEEGAGTNLCSACHSEKYVRSVLSEGFDVIDFVREGAKGNPFQDLYLFRAKHDV
jgi:SAM-dependent methyltransferase